MSQLAPSVMAALALEPLVLEEEFEAEEQEPTPAQPAAACAARQTEGKAGPPTEPTPEEMMASHLDFLNLKSDPQLARFFEACGQTNRQKLACLHAC